MYIALQIISATSIMNNTIQTGTLNTCMHGRDYERGRAHGTHPKPPEPLPLDIERACDICGLTAVSSYNLGLADEAKHQRSAGAQKMSLLLIPEAEIKTEAEYRALYAENPGDGTLSFEDWLFFQLLEPSKEDSPWVKAGPEEYEMRDAEIRRRIAKILK